MAHESSPSRRQKRRLAGILALAVITVTAAIVYVNFRQDGGATHKSPESGPLESDYPDKTSGVNKDEVSVSDYGFSEVGDGSALSIGVIVENDSDTVAQNIMLEVAPQAEDGTSLNDSTYRITVPSVMPDSSAVGGRLISKNELGAEINKVHGLKFTIGKIETWWKDNGTFAKLNPTSLGKDIDFETRSGGYTNIEFLAAGSEEIASFGISYMVVGIFRDRNRKILGSCSQEVEVVGDYTLASFSKCFLPPETDKGKTQVHSVLMIDKVEGFIS